VSAGIETNCACCDKPLRITLDSDGVWNVDQKEATPMVFHPEIDWSTFTKANIIDDF